MVNAGVPFEFAILDNVEYGIGKIACVCWGACLVEDDFYLRLGSGEREHGLYEVVSKFGIEPCRAYYDMLAVGCLYSLFSVKFCETVNACWRSFLVFMTRSVVRVSAKYVIGTDMYE